MSSDHLGSKVNYLIKFKLTQKELCELSRPLSKKGSHCFSPELRKKITTKSPSFTTTKKEHILIYHIIRKLFGIGTKTPLYFHDTFGYFISKKVHIKY